MKCTPHDGINVSWKPAEKPWVPGGFERRSDDLAIWWGSATFPVTQPGKHTIQITGVGKSGQYTFFDGMKILSAESIYGPECGYFPTMGEANGQDPRGGFEAFVNTLHNEVDWTASWGLKTMAYEGGWSVGGDFDQKPIHAYCKYASPETIVADGKAIDIYTSGGGSLFCYFYGQWGDNKDIDNAVQYPLVQAVIKRNDRLSAEVNYGVLVPGNLTPENNTLRSKGNTDFRGNLTAQGSWISWNIIVPVTQAYSLTSTVTGTEGSYSLLVDDATVVQTGSLGKNLCGALELTKGQHAVKVRNTGTSPISVKNVAATMKGGPAAPVLSPVDFGKGGCAPSWTPSPSATGYRVYYGTCPGNYTSLVKVSGSTGTTITGLDNAGVYYFVVQAVNSGGLLSLSSNEQRLARRSTEPQMAIDFEDQLVTGSDMPELIIRGFKLTAFGNSGHFQVQGKDGGDHWESNVLRTVDWGNRHRIQREDLQPFDLYSLDLDSTYGGGSAVITGYDPSGAKLKKVINFPGTKGKFVVPVVLDWVHIVKLEIAWCEAPDGVASLGRNGAIDNLLFNKAGLK